MRKKSPNVRVPTGKQKQAGHIEGQSNVYLQGWRPSLRDARWDIGAAWIPSAARAIDSLTNSGWIAGGINAAIAQIIGLGLRLNARPDFEAIGWAQPEADEWSADVERRWEVWTTDPAQFDLGGRMTFAQFQNTALRQYFATGEIVVMLPYRRRYGSRMGTKVQLIPSHRLDIMSYTGDGIIQGVIMDRDSFPVGYRFRMTVPDNGLGVDQYVNVPARDAYGRPYVVHIFDAEAGAVRGITPLAPALKVVRQFDQLADATLTSSLIQAIFAATVESQAPTENVLDAIATQGEQSGVIGGTMEDFIAARDGWYDGTAIDLGTHGKIAHLFPGEKLNFNKVESPTSMYEPFAKFLLREVARCIGCTFEQLTGDYTGATYSSVRMAASDFWQLTLHRRSNIIGRVSQAIYEAWLEEQIDIGEIQIPGGSAGFLSNRPAYCRADWRGPPKPQADDNKLAQAHKTWYDLGVISKEMICNDLGVDFEDVANQLAQEAVMEKRLGIDAVSKAAEMTAATAPQEQDPADGNEDL
jgi:lambda family phage portal protein